MIGIAGEAGNQQVWLVEVAVHLDGLNYRGPEKTVSKVATKLATAREYAASTYSDHHAIVEF